MDHVADSVPVCEFRAALAAVATEFSSVIGLPPPTEACTVHGFSNPLEPRTGTLLFTLSPPDEALLGRLKDLDWCVVIVPKGYGEAVATLGHVALETTSPKYAFARLARALVPLTTERYEFAIPEELWDTPMVQKLVQTLAEQETKAAIDTLGGYDTSQTGQFTWVE